jgi:hypothetical protein
MCNGEVGKAQRWGTLPRKRCARVVGAFAWTPRSTPSRSEANQVIGGIFSTRASNKLQNPCKNSGRAAVYGWRGGSICKKVIGHRMRPIAPRFRVGKDVGRTGRAISLLQEQARQHGGGVLLHPLVQQSADFLAEIGGMRESRQLKTLQGVPRSGQKELPGWLGRAGGHRPPFWDPRRLS